ncbi:hypothetical protein A2U01_0007643, partial [Trifolium medium]|nr:hypothetical protein [Trifolium medium]
MPKIGSHSHMLAAVHWCGTPSSCTYCVRKGVVVPTNDGGFGGAHCWGFMSIVADRILRDDLNVLCE